MADKSYRDLRDMTESTDATMSVPMEEGNIEAEGFLDMVRWRMGFLGGYCSVTNREHQPEDFIEYGGVLRKMTSSDRAKCGRCGLSITRESYHRLLEISWIRRGIEDSNKSVRIAPKSEENTKLGKQR